MLKGKGRTKAELTEEVVRLRQHMAELEAPCAAGQGPEPRDSLRFLEIVIDAIPGMTMVIDRDYRIVLANRVARELAGGEDPVAAHRTCYSVSHHREAPCEGLEHPCPLEQVARTRAPVVVEHTHLDAGGGEVFVEITAAPIFDDAGEVVRIVECCRDIIERKKVEERLHSYQKQLQRLALELSSAEERERRRVAEGLHDEVSQSLGALSLHLQVLSGASLSPPQKAALSQSRDLLREMSRSVRTLTFELCPPMLYETGLAPALAWLVEQSRQRFEGRLDFECGEGVPPFPEEVRAFAFRAARELLINALKHASARNIRLRLTAEGAHMTISVEDDGVGFDPEAIHLGGPGRVAFGLFSVRERARGLGGRLDIVAAAGRGSRLTLVLPAGE